MLPADILLAKDAAGVAGGMDLSPTVSMVVFGIAVIGMAIALFPFHLKKPSIKQQLLQTIGTGVAMVVWMTGVLWYGPIPKALGLSPIPGRAKQLYDSAGFITGFMSCLGHLSPRFLKAIPLLPKLPLCSSFLQNNPPHLHRTL